MEPEKEPVNYLRPLTEVVFGSEALTIGLVITLVALLTLGCYLAVTLK
jgi:hypothetical protein